MPALNTPIGILGGTFDPIHHGHLRVAEEVADALALAQVRLVPCGRPPHRAAPLFSATQRLAFCELATRSNPRLIVDAREVHQATPSYTVETLEALAAEHPNTPLVLILGADAFMGLPTWHRWTELLERAHIAVVTRPNYALTHQMPKALRSLFETRSLPDSTYGAMSSRLAGSIVTVTVPGLDISSSRIRALLREGKSVRYLVPEAIVEPLRDAWAWRRSA